MRIQHNLSAMNSLNNYNGNNNKLSGNLEKLSSGYRINSAADDAAGLAISEKMRSQIAGLEKAQDNANDGISLVQTAEGALTEVNSMLTRLTELATQSANGTYDDTTDRVNIQEETDAILSEMDRISQSTNFNGINLLDGSLSGKSQVTNLAMDSSTAIAGKYTVAGATTTTGALTALTVDDIGKSLDYTVTWETSAGEQKTTTVSLTYQGQGDGTIGDTTKETNYFTDGQGNKYYLDATDKLANTDIDKAVIAGLKGDEEFNSTFSISGTGATLAFEAKEVGDAGAKIISTGTDSNLSIKNDTIAAGGGGTAKVTTEAMNAMQKFDVTSIKLADSNDTASVLAEKVFEIDGHKFLVNGSGGNTLTADQRKALGSDITIINAATGAGGTLGTEVAAATGDREAIASEISRVTGLSTKLGTAVDNTGISTNDILFTEDTLKLGGTELSLQVGDTNKSFQKVAVKIQDMSSSGLGLSGLNLGTQETASSAIDTIKSAVNAVSTQRGQLGAIQNRLDYTINNLEATDENITAAESQIRDVDMAKEMTEYSKNNILVQAAQSMLAQANSMPQGVLQLLQ